MKTIAFILIIGAIGLQLIADESPFGGVQCEKVGFVTGDGVVTIDLKTGSVKWSKTPKPEIVALLDQVVLQRKELTDSDELSLFDAILHYNLLIQNFKQDKRPTGINDSEDAAKLWKTLKAIFPKSVKGDNP